MAQHPRGIVIVGAKRTAFGTLQGMLAGVPATDLAVHAAGAALAQARLAPDAVDQVLLGNVLQSASDAIYCARHVGLKSGVRITAPALTLNRLCGSGFQALVSGAEQLLLGEAQVVLAGGTESMTQAPHVLRGARDGLTFGRGPLLEDSLFSALTDSYCAAPMAITAENLAAKYDISREQCDEYALQSQQRWARADDSKLFDDEIAPLPVVRKRQQVEFGRDEHPRPKTTAEALAKLPALFKQDGVVTAGNASGICDGAACLVLATEEFAAARELRPLARVLGWGLAGVDPSIMGIGPVPAIRAALTRAGLRQDRLDLFEVNEAFAAQYLAVEKELGLPRDRTNVNGGAIAIGHPLGASGARIATHLVYELSRRRARYGVGSACIGGGQGIAVVLENCVNASS